jgi:hypothetical protein
VVDALVAGGDLDPAVLDDAAAAVGAVAAGAIEPGGPGQYVEAIAARRCQGVARV